MLNNLQLALYLCVFVITLSGCGIGNNSAVFNQPPNILLIVADDLGYTDLGCYGSEIRTPYIDTLAANGILNTAFYTAPTCSPTRAMLLSGVDNHRNGYGTMEGNWAENQLGVRGYEGHLNFDVVAFPKLLQEAGYHTSISGKWHQAYPANNQKLWPDKRGFGRSFCLLQGGAGHFEDQQKLFSFFERTLYTEDGELIDHLPEDFYSSDYYTQKTIEFIDESLVHGKPFFSYLSFTAPHWPLQVPDEIIDLYKGRYDNGYEVLAEERLVKAKDKGIISKSVSLPHLSPNIKPWLSLSTEEQKVSARIMEVYAAMIERLDENVGKLIRHLKETDLYDNTLIVFMADNGAEGNSIWGIGDTKEWVAQNFDNDLPNIGRKNSYVFTGPGWAQVSSLPFKWYKAFSSEGGVRTPSIICFPKWNQLMGKQNDDFISVMDLAPTFLDLAGVQHPGNEYADREIFSMDGISLLPWLKGESLRAHDPDRAHCWELYGRRAVRKGDWKAIWLDAPYGKETWELYNLVSDPGEQKDLASSHAAKLDDLIEAWDLYESKYNLTLPNEKVAYGIEEYWSEERD